MTNDVLKVCSMCKGSKLITYFNKNKSQKDGLSTNCRECGIIYNRKYYQKNKEALKADSKIRHKKYCDALRQYVYDYLKNNGCIDCGEKDPIVLEFDHIRGEKKDNISTMVGKPCSLVELVEEINKCVVRCSNCHKRKTAKEQNWYADVKK